MCYREVSEKQNGGDDTKIGIILQISLVERADFIFIFTLILNIRTILRQSNYRLRKRRETPTCRICHAGWQKTSGFPGARTFVAKLWYILFELNYFRKFYHTSWNKRVILPFWYIWFQFNLFRIFYHTSWKKRVILPFWYILFDFNFLANFILLRGKNVLFYHFDIFCFNLIFSQILSYFVEKTSYFTILIYCVNTPNEMILTW